LNHSVTPMTSHEGLKSHGDGTWNCRIQARTRSNIPSGSAHHFPISPTTRSFFVVSNSQPDVQLKVLRVRLSRPLHQGCGCLPSHPNDPFLHPSLLPLLIHHSPHPSLSLPLSHSRPKTYLFYELFSLVAQAEINIIK